MAAPEFVPLKPTDAPRSYSSPPRRPESWMADRPGEVGGAGSAPQRSAGQPGTGPGVRAEAGPPLRRRAVPHRGEHEEDAHAGCITVALKRSSLFGRAPVIHDLTIAFTLWGFLDDTPAPELVEIRRALFAEVRNPHHYAEQRAIADAVPESTLRMLPAEVKTEHQTDWRSLLDV